MPDVPAWLLLLVLVTGETGQVPILETACRSIEASLAAGNVVMVDLVDGRSVQVAWAACVPPCNCDEEPTS